jgi:hypothetical protein
MSGNSVRYLLREPSARPQIIISLGLLAAFYLVPENGNTSGLLAVF